MDECKPLINGKRESELVIPEVFLQEYAGMVSIISPKP